MDIIKIEKDKEKAKSLFNLAMLRYNRLGTFNVEKETSLLVESYYEICKELITAILFIDGCKTLSHKELINYIGSNYKDIFSNDDIITLNTLRVRRNNIVYEGVFVDSFYVKKNEEYFKDIIKKLTNLIKKKL